MKKAIVNESLKIIGITALVTVTWQVLELIIWGEIRTDKVDNIVAGILSMSLYYNLRYWNGSGT